MVYRYEPAEDPCPEDPAPGPGPAGSGPSGSGPAPVPTGTGASGSGRAPVPTAAEADGTRTTVPAPAPLAPVPPPDPARRMTEPLHLFRAGRHHRQRGRGWQALVGGSAVLVLLALCGVAVAGLLQDRLGTPQAGPSPSRATAAPAGAGATDLGSRDTDPVALTAEEVFAHRQLVVSAGKPAYEVLGTNVADSCPVATSGEVAELLVRLGCNQVVRATLRSPAGTYLLTAGLVNLTDAAGAREARDRIRQLLDERRGRFRGMATGPGTEAVAQAAARVGWQVRGHYLSYCLVTRADGQRIAADNAEVRGILYDVIERYLNGTVLERRANGTVADVPTGGATRPGGNGN
jgi:hypothetical protein